MKTIDLSKKWIYWRWKKWGKSFSKSFVQAVVKTSDGKYLLDLNDSTIWSNYPTRVLLSEIEYKIEKP